MEEPLAQIPQPSQHHERSGWSSSVLIVLTIIVGFLIIGNIIGLLVAIPFMRDGFFAFIEKMRSPSAHPEIKTPLLVIQSCVTFFGLAACPALYWWVYERKNPFELLKGRPVKAGVICLAALLVICFMPVNSVIIEWNSSIHFPDFMGGFDSWARQNEALDEQLMTLFTTFDSVGQFIFVFFTISLLAGFSEELVFRGMLQPQLQRATGNIHVAIWISAVLFSSLHLQFFGFVPRMLLGALFGYLYFWTENLMVPMLAHMFNNGIAVIAIYINQKADTRINLDDPTLPLPVVIAGFILTGSLLYYFYSFHKTRIANSP